MRICFSLGKKKLTFHLKESPNIFWRGGPHTNQEPTLQRANCHFIMVFFQRPSVFASCWMFMDGRGWSRTVMDGSGWWSVINGDRWWSCTLLPSKNMCWSGHASESPWPILAASGERYGNLCGLPWVLPEGDLFLFAVRIHAFFRSCLSAGQNVKM